MNRKFHLVLFFVISVLVASAASGEKAYWFNFPAESDYVRLMFPSPTESVVYQSMPTAVELITIVCDGRELVPVIRNVINAPLMKTIATDEMKNGIIVYQCTPAFLGCWDNLREKPEKLRMRHFDIPRNVNHIVINYRIRFPNGTASPLLTVNLIASDQEVELFVPPEKK